MTKETKIGLLVGLTFIILFAIILSKKGPNSSKSTSNMMVADAQPSDGASRLSGARPLDGVGKVPMENLLPAPISSEQNNSAQITMIEEPVEGQPIPGEDTPIEPLPDSVISRLNIPMVETEVPVDKEGVEDEDSAELGNSVVDALNGTPTLANPHNSAPTTVTPFANTGPTSTFPSLTPSNTASQTRPPIGSINPAHSMPTSIDNSASTRLSSNPQVNGPITTPTTPAKPTKLIAEHEVKAGESLGKIAAKYYGRSTPNRIDAIFNANRDQLDSVNAVKAKTKLKIPLLEGEFAGMFEQVDGLAPKPIQNANGQSNPRGNQAVAGNNSRRDNAVLIPIPVDERTKPQANEPRTARQPNQAVNDRPLNIQPPKAAEVKYTWYEVREKDTLSKIAKSQLGSEKKYRDIAKINGDILPDQHKLKPGMKIRLPMKDKPAATSPVMSTSIAIDPSADE